MDRTLCEGSLRKLAPTPHTAIIARSLNLPAVVGLQNLTQNLHTGQLILLDGYNGLVILDPSEATIAHYEELERKQAKITDQLKARLSTALKQFENRPFGEFTK